MNPPAPPTELEPEALADASIEARLELSVRAARTISFYRDWLPATTIENLDDFHRLPQSSRVDLSMAEDLSELIFDPRRILRSTHPFHQNVCTFPFQVVAGEQDLVNRHHRMVRMVDSLGFGTSGEVLILASPPQLFFASDFSAEILFHGPHCSLQNIVHLDQASLRRRIEDFGAELLVLATTDSKLSPAVIPDCVRAIVTFRGGYPEMAKLDVDILDIYTLTEVPYLGCRVGGERPYRFDPEQFFVERSPSGALTVTTLQWEVMPFIRYQTYDLCGEVDMSSGSFEITSFGEW